MERLVESIKERGVITPAMVRQKEDGRYELVSGHRRKRASQIAGFPTLRCEVVELTRDEAIILMVESNYQRTQQLPSERAFAYKMRLDAMARQGKRTDLTCATKLHKSDGKKSRDTVADKSGETVRRYIRLTNLVPELLDMVDNSVVKDKDTLQMALKPAVELSYDKTFVTDKNGEILIEGLRIGEYTVSEVVDGVSSAYSRPSDKKANVMTDSTTIVEMHNILIDNPKTGDESKVGLWLGLLSLSVLGVGTTVLIGFKRKKKDGEQ